MKILLSAIACNPYLGSENYFGWSAVRALARDHELWVLTGSRNEPDLRRAMAEGLVPDHVHFVYAGRHSPWHPNLLRARLQNWREYQQFSGAILPVARKLHAIEKFEVVHHVTFSTWRVASPLWELGIPFVFGPVGGYEQFPLRLLPILSPMAAAFELARMASNVVSRHSSGVRRCVREAAQVLVANTETEQLVKSLRGSDRGVSKLMANFHSAARMESFARHLPDKNLTGPLRLFAAGNMEGRKGVALALAALAEAKRNGVNFRYRLGAAGPEIGHLKSLAVRLGLKDDVVFGEGLRGEAYQSELGQTHIYLLPSLRDSAPVTLTEAMLAGCVPIVAGGGGPELMVTGECGYKIPVAGRREMVRRMTEAIITLDRNRQLIGEKGRLASAHIAANFSEEHYRDSINFVYQLVTKTAQPHVISL